MIEATERDLATTPKAICTSIQNGASCHSSPVKGAAAGGDRSSTAHGRHRPRRAFSSAG
jgi:hypothetical protein